MLGLVGDGGWGGSVGDEATVLGEGGALATGAFDTGITAAGSDVQVGIVAAGWDAMVGMGVL